ncbi:arsenate reductase ArsC [Spiribacter halobius]|uniref:Arsenate reductase n=1 Tax=Sediminicurvatus halobius TaxID=2182432 RepID=A0A2U2N7H7_9GAMM|nr:arsenate reductase ArsC [Spiribacter halobius]PWG65116.1 arsenate reductase [Spiribacter halobius]UEX78935.1 arsenate reductase ArsC [Spiribacter halobius]
MTRQRPRVLFLCTGNACRSQMAEGFARAHLGDAFEVHSAGTSPHGVDPRAATVMAERGIDLSAHRSKHVDDLHGLDFDWVVTVCDRAAEACPVFPGAARRLHRSFEDPPRLAREAATEAEALAPYRRVRDEIEAFVRTLPETLAQEHTA